MTTEDAAIYTALIVAVPTVLTAVVVPIVLRYLDMKAAADKDERDMKRQDEVARRALEAVVASKEVSEKNTRLIQANTEMTQDMKETVEKVKVQTDGLTSAAVANAKEKGEAQGNLTGRKEQTAERIAEADEILNGIPNKPLT